MGLVHGVLADAELRLVGQRLDTWTQRNIADTGVERVDDAADEEARRVGNADLSAASFRLKELRRQAKMRKWLADPCEQV